MGVVYAKDTCSVGWSQGDSFMRKGQAWDSDSALVRERPDLFSDEPEGVAGRRTRVERATRAPGEQRGPRRGPRR